MKCGQCRSREAAVRLQTVLDNRVSELALCAPCAEGLAPFSMMAHLLAMGPRRLREAPALKCGACAVPWAAFQKTHLLGCPGCYLSFADRMEDLLPRLQGAERHRGRQPGGEAQG